MSFDRAKKHLEKFGLDKNVMEFSTSSATVEEAARLLHCTEGEIAKTLSFLVDEKAILVVVAGDRKIDDENRLSREKLFRLLSYLTKVAV